jgi:hypothetical protein
MNIWPIILHENAGTPAGLIKMFLRKSESCQVDSLRRFSAPRHHYHPALKTLAGDKHPLFAADRHRTVTNTS